MLAAVDVGGTFTDLLYLSRDGQLGFLKVLSTPREPERAVVEGLRRIAARSPVREVVHATTLATNALRGQRGLEPPRTAFVTTKGFRDIIEIGRQNRPRLYDLFFEKPRPLAPRELRFELDERVDASGRVLKPLNQAEVEELGLKLRELGVESAAVCLLHSYLRPEHEELAGRILSKHVRYVSLSHRVAPEPREYERASTTLVNAVLQPLVSRYLTSLAGELEGIGVRGLYLMSSSGGLVDSREAAERPVQIIESGPAAGAVAAAELARMLGLGRVISFDMGGTTAKAALVANGEVEVTTEYEVGGESHHGRVVKGSGYPVRFPFIDLAEVSAGGGTIIWRDEAGALAVGPVSAGSEPGPACYGRGGREPTVTDANLVLGRLGESLLDGSLRLDRRAAETALSRLGDPADVAARALELINLEMARGVRLVTVERGFDPADHVLVAFGGAGPQFAAFLAEELGIREVLVPPHPGLFSAWGLLAADWRFEARSAYPDPEALEETYRRMEESLTEKLGHADYFVRSADVRYRGQGWELTVPVGRPASLESVKRAFEERHEATFGFTLGLDVEIVVARVFAVKLRPKPGLPRPPAGEPVKPGSRRVFFEDGWVETPVYRRESLPVGFVGEGPAIVEEYSSTTVVPPGWEFSVGNLGELRLVRVG
ncbi:MAG: hydantoinase/oxoprolinase family protein [Thermofilaceae archaeon]